MLLSGGKTITRKFKGSMDFVKALMLFSLCNLQKLISRINYRKGFSLKETHLAMQEIDKCKFTKFT